MNLQEISERLRTNFADAVLDVKADAAVDPFIKIAPPRVADIARALRDDPDLAFDYLMCLSGVDYAKGTLGVVYHLFSFKHRHKLTIKVEVPGETPNVPSVAAIWPTANWHEREAYDLIGIVFTGHPDLRRILLPDDWDGFPLRKDYKVPEFYRGMKVPY